jgi:transposase-like protein
MQTFQKIEDNQNLTALVDIAKPNTNYDATIRAKAFHLFLNSAATVEEIGLELGVPSQVIKAWITHNKWEKIKENLEKELWDISAREFRDFIRINRLPTAKRHLEIAETLEQTIKEKLEALKASEELPHTSDIKRLSEALSSVTAVSSRAVGLTTDSSAAITAGNEADRIGKQPLFIIGAQPIIISQESKQKALDAEFEESNIKPQGENNE